MSTTKEFPTGLHTFTRKKVRLAADVKALKGTQAAINLTGASQGYATPGAAATNLLAVGRFNETVDNTGGAAGAKKAEVDFLREVKCLRMLNDVGSPVDWQDFGQPVHFKDNNTVTASPVGTSGAGTMWGIDEDGLILVEPVSTLVPDATDAASVSIADSGTLFASADVEGALAELANNKAQINFPLSSFVLAADGSPLVAFDDGVADGFDYIKGVAYRFNVASTGKIAASVELPLDIDPDADIVIKMKGGRVGASDVTAALTLEAFFQTAGAAYDADADAGGASTAFDGATTVVTVESRTILAADVPAAPATLSITLVPTAALDADDLRLISVWAEIERKNIAV